MSGIVRANNTSQSGVVSENISYKSVTFTRAMDTASGTQVITGIGFTSKRVFFEARVLADNQQSSTAAEIWPADTKVMLYDARNESGGIWGINEGLSILMVVSGSATYRGDITTMGSDGFTFTWTRGGTPSGTIQIVAHCEG
jgi:hypothetical protein